MLEGTLLRSPALASARRIVCQRGFPSVAKAYNKALRESEDDLLLLVHPDVFLPEQWPAALDRSLAWLSENDPNWGVLGLYGVTDDAQNRGFAYSTGLGGFVGRPFSYPAPVSTVDEFAFLVRRETGLTFDERIPSAQFQLGATDLCLEARRRGFSCYAVPCFALHNSNGWSFLPWSFWPCYLYIRRKWRSELPVHAPYAQITRTCMPLVWQSARGMLRRKTHRRNTRVDDPAGLYERLRTELLRSLQ